MELIRPEDLKKIQDVRQFAAVADREAKLAQQAVEIAQLRVFIRYGLTEKDSFDIATGEVKRFQEIPVSDEGEKLAP